MNKRRQTNHRKHEDEKENSVEIDVLEALTDSLTLWKKGKCFSASPAAR